MLRNVLASAVLANALVALGALLSSLTATAQAARIVPDPVNAWQTVGLLAPVGVDPGCSKVATARSVTRQGQLVLVEYEFVERELVIGCFSPRGVELHAPLGSFPPGTYTVRWFRSGTLAIECPQCTQGETQFTVVAPPAREAYARVELVAGDRQVIDTTQTLATLRVRVIDERGQPVAGQQLVMFPALAIGQAAPPVDAFGWFGFNAARSLHLPLWNILSFLSEPFRFGELATTDADGYATVEPNPNYRFLPGSLLFGIYAWPDPASARPRFFSFVATDVKPPGSPRVVVEFVHEPSGNYFITQDDAEIARLDAGTFAGWKRSVGSFIAYADPEADVQTAPVCRFFSARFTSHFYTASAAECDDVAGRWPDVWTLETRSAFRVIVPDPSTGECPAGTQPVYRLFNAKAAANHRYVTDRTLRTAMVERGWIAEGAGPESVAMCSPA